jgi:hypothetical protein
MLGDPGHELHGRGVPAQRPLDVAADHEHVVGADLGHPGEDRIELSGVAHHPRGNVDCDGVPGLAEHGGHLHPAVGAVLRRAGDRHAHGARQRGRPLGDASEGKHLEPGPIVWCGDCRRPHCLEPSRFHP